MKVLKVVGWVLFGLSAAALLGLALGLPVMWLWNWLMPALFHLPAVGYWQAVGLLLLCHLLFKGHGRGFGHRRRHDREHWDGFARRVKSSLDAGGPQPPIPAPEERGGGR